MLKGSKILLNPIAPTDFMLLYRWADDTETQHLNEPYRPPNWKLQQDFWMSEDPNRVLFAIRKLDMSMIGYVQIMNISTIHRSASIGIRIGEKQHRNAGFGTEAMELSLKYCWNILNLSRVTLTVFAHNAPAIKVYENLGFQQEGVLKKSVYIDGSYVDVVQMAINLPSR